MDRVRTMILGGRDNEARVGAVEQVMARNGFEGPCSADLHHQGGGLWFLLIGIAPAVFLKSFAEAAGEDAWKAIKNLYRELREALGQDDESHGQLYIREGGETKAEWEASDRKAPLPGLPPQGEHPPQIVIDSILPDEALKALFEIDFSQLASTSFEWDRKRREWVPKERW
jgi:hypothetical protein